MSEQIDTLNTAIASVQASVTAQATRVQSQLDALNATIADLKAHPASPDLTSQIASLQSVADTLNSEFPAAVVPAPASN